MPHPQKDKISPIVKKKKKIQVIQTTDKPTFTALLSKVGLSVV